VEHNRDRGGSAAAPIADSLLEVRGLHVRLSAISINRQQLFGPYGSRPFGYDSAISQSGGPPR